jgi:hypothetical protein
MIAQLRSTYPVLLLGWWFLGSWNTRSLVQILVCKNGQLILEDGDDVEIH